MIAGSESISSSGLDPEYDQMFEWLLCLAQVLQGKVRNAAWQGAPPKAIPTQGTIELRAYQIFLERGARDGRDLDDWLEAERQLRGEGA